MFRLTLLITISLFFASCGVEDAAGLIIDRSCGPDIEIGSYDIKEESFDYYSYNADDTLVFEDQDGKQITFTLKLEKDLKASKININELCSDGIFDSQYEYFDIERQYIIFKSDKNVNDYFRIDLRTTVTYEDDINDKIIYDGFSFNCSISADPRMYVCDFHIPTAFHQNEALWDEKKYHRNYPREIKDTIIDERQYEDVLIIENWDERILLYNKKEGVVLIKDNSENYLRLKK